MAAIKITKKTKNKVLYGTEMYATVLLVNCEEDRF